MKEFRIAVLTHHIGHSSSNSLYGIVRALVKHPQVEKVGVISRGDIRNANFFSGKEQAELITHQATENFAFPADRLFENDIVKTNIQEYDFILLRLPRPIGPHFFDHLTKVFPETKIVNRPSGIQRTGSKEYLMNFPDFTAPIKICNSLEDIIDFKNKFPFVLKPFEEYGGKGLIRIDGDQVWIGNQAVTDFSTFVRQYNENPTPYLGMKFLKNVNKGDKRIVVANGKILATSLRIPGEGQWLCNIAQGGTSVDAQVDEQEQKIVAHISPILKSEGIFLYGLDTLEGDDGKRVISEINTLSVGGLSPAEANTGLPINKMFAEEFINYIKTL